MKLLYLVLVLTAAVALTPPACAEPQPGKARFEGELIAKLLPDGRNVKLVAPFSYIDAEGTRWDVPVGVETDGASIPRAFWIAYPPFTGKYREAAVIHDHFCRNHARSWKRTHQVFLEAMLTSGVDGVTAKAMYGAVYLLGPRWGFGAHNRGPGAAKVKTEAEQLAFVKRLEHWVQRENPPLAEIEKAVESGAVP